MYLVKQEGYAHCYDMKLAMYFSVKFRESLSGGLTYGSKGFQLYPGSKEIDRSVHIYLLE